jgi:hypothetical protein
MVDGLSAPDYTVQTDLNVWIPVRDGVRLSATMYRPREAGRFPVIFRCDGYRKDLNKKGELRRIGHWFAERGYVYVLADIRGTGDSEGIATDEYSAQELQDACDAIAWLAAQPWSSGAVGMWGKSYSGFNSIQTAMLRPAPLKAIIPIYATDDRYTDDVHYWGGLRHVGSFIPYPLKMIYSNLLPPTPDIHGNGWRALWQKRIEESPPWLLAWWRQQTDGPYWRHGSLRPNYEAIDVPVFMVGGWRDGYTNSIPRMLRKLQVPCKALIGPWGHELPQGATLGPQVDFLGMMLRWWDHWLKGIDTGLMEEPPITYFLQDYHVPGPVKGEAGQWRTLDRWPEEGEAEAVYWLGAGGDLLPEQPAAEGRDFLPGSLRLTTGEWKWCLYDPQSLPDDQRAAEAYSLVYSSPPLEQEIELLGQARLRLTLASSQPAAQLFARLCDVAPDGQSTLVSWGALNLTHRDGHTDPTSLEPGRAYTVEIEFGAVSWRFQPGHRLRLILSNHDWPRLWPAPQLFDLEVQHGQGSFAALHLPLAPDASVDIGPLPPPPEIETKAAAGPEVRASNDPWQWRLIQERPENRLRFTLGREESLDLVDGSLRETTYRTLEVSVPEDDPGGNAVATFGTTTMEWPGVKATVTADLRIIGEADCFDFDLKVDVFENDDLLAHKEWRERIPRQLV